MKKNKGFTLIEMLTVIVILAIVALITIPLILKYIDKAKDEAKLRSAENYLKASENEIVSRMLKGETFTNATCIIDEGSLFCDEKEIKLSVKGEKPYSGTITFDKEKVIAYKAIYLDGCVIVLDENNLLVHEGKVNIEKKCNYEIGQTFEFDYTGNEQVFVPECKGKYILETWGASGGYGICSGSLSSSVKLGYGGYSRGVITLEKNETIYINVGERGKNAINKQNVEGSYNGGGGATWDTTDDEASAGGGGATHIAKVSGLLSTLENNISDILIVSGGGGGNSCSRVAGSGGGFQGVTLSSTGSIPATQESGYAFGLGETGVGMGGTSSGGNDGVGGGGGGFYGGFSNNKLYSSAGTGGSGYIGNTLLSNKSMYCFGCVESSEETTKTFAIKNVSSKPISIYPKNGNGYARITYIAKDSYSSILEGVKNSKKENDSYDSFYINEEVYNLHTYSYTGNQEWTSDMVFGDENDIATDTEYAKNTIVVKVNGDLTINEGVTVTTTNSIYGGPKGLILYVTGKLINNGTISMTARGAKAPGQNIYLWKNSNGTYEYVPAIGAVGGTYRTGKGGVSTVYTGYTPAAAANRKTGGGGGGGMIAVGETTTSGSGGTGTSYSGGAGGGGAYYGATAGSGSSEGGAGGNGAAKAIYTYGSGGGAGNSIGKCVSNCSAATNGTGGLLVIYANNLTNNGSITANGSKGGNAYRAGGGGSGGGSINIFYNTLTEKGTITANGGSYGVGTRSSSERSNGGSGGAGTVTLGSIATGNFVLQE